MPVCGSLNSVPSESPRLKFPSFYVTKNPLQLAVSALHLTLQQYQIHGTDSCLRIKQQVSY